MAAAKCEICEEEFSQEIKRPRMLDCGCILCERCLKGIFKFQRMFKCNTHKIITERPIEQLEVIAVETQKSTLLTICKVHQEPLTFYCLQDSLRICGQCQQDTHMNHHSGRQEEMVPVIQRTIQMSLSSIKERLDKSIQALEQYQEQLVEANTINRDMMVQFLKNVKRSTEQACEEVTIRAYQLESRTIEEIKQSQVDCSEMEQQVEIIRQMQQETLKQCEDKRSFIEKLEVQVQEKQLKEQQRYSQVKDQLKLKNMQSQVIEKVLNEIEEENGKLRAQKLAYERIIQNLFKEIQVQVRDHESKNQESQRQLQQLQQQIKEKDSNLNDLRVLNVQQRKLIKDKKQEEGELLN